MRQRIPAQRHYKISWELVRHFWDRKCNFHKNNLNATLIATISISLFSFRNVQGGASTRHASQIKHDISTMRGSKVSAEGRAGETQGDGEGGSDGNDGGKMAPVWWESHGFNKSAQTRQGQTNRFHHSCCVGGRRKVTSSYQLNWQINRLDGKYLRGRREVTKSDEK